MSHYGKFGAMIATSMICMYATTYLNTYTLDHIFWSETRMYMTFIMGSVMAVVMLLFMWSMYEKLVANIFILLVSTGIVATSVYLVRSQIFVDQLAYMKAMIPHHSIAILTSERATITDPKVKALAEQIIKAQVAEIGMMKRYIADLEADRPATDIGTDMRDAPISR